MGMVRTCMYMYINGCMHIHVYGVCVYMCVHRLYLHAHKVWMFHLVKLHPGVVLYLEIPGTVQKSA